ncbi:hypothetical protein [Desulfothermobacter acidiphilus]|uniref:hypothetical protein n=1 Tax=Desulfothermobacter acidiphilus TaxID=1938353 RepID=UPI003F88C852
MKAQVGFSQRIRLEWLEYTAQLVIEGRSRKEIKARLEELLKKHLSVGRDFPTIGNREKAIVILLKIWSSPPESLVEFRNDGLKLLQAVIPELRLAVHWGMTMAVYPFVAAVAEIVGKLLLLQGSVARAQVLRRLCEQLGERETVTRAARRVIRCFVDWGVLQDTPRKGVYQGGPVREIEDERLAAWLVEATLIARGVTLYPLNQLVAPPALFPFRLRNITPWAIEENGRLTVQRQGGDKDMVVAERRH